MLKLLIVSDSHGLKDELVDLVNRYKDYQVLHLGDYCISEKILDENNIIYVKGNCDFSRSLESRVLNIEGYKIFMTHGHKYKVKSNYMNIYYKALEENVNYCLFGHTHNEAMFKENKITFINPGSYKDSRSYVLIEDDKVYFKRD